MVVNATKKTTTTANEPAQNVTQTTAKADTVKKPAAEEKKVSAAETKKTAAKKAPAKKTTTRKTAASRKTTKKTATKKTAAKKETTVTKAEVFIQYKGMESSESEVMEKVTAAWEAEGKKASAIKRVKLYIKPEDFKAYYVINEGLKNCSTGAVDLL